MLRRKKFSRMEILFLRVVAALIFAAGLAGVWFGLRRGQWSLTLASMGTLGIAAVYLIAARRGNPL
jgi:hypothetical protein